MDNLEEQKEELFSIDSILNVYEKNFTFEEKNPPCGHFKANVWLPDSYYVMFKVEKANDCSEISHPSTSIQESFEIKYLPPINLFFELPETYPSHTCPAFLLSCKWLTPHQLSCLCKHLESMWDKDTQILFSWCQFLENEVLDFLNIKQCLDITELLTFKVSDNFLHLKNLSIKSSSEEEKAHNGSKSSVNIADFKETFPVIKPSLGGGSEHLDCRAFNDLTDGQSLMVFLKNFNDFKKMDIYNREYHECDICVTSKIGTDFIVFPVCNHAFCKECLKEFFEVHIKEGNVNFLNCPGEKCSSEADGSMVRQIVDKNLFERYDHILLSRTLETMGDIGYCPRKWCQCPVVIDSTERIASCPSCSYVFCPFCKAAYHGVAPCSFKTEEKRAIFEQYIEGGADVKELLEKRHGKRAIKALVEDSLSEDWKNSNSKNCPHCKASIEKNDGCNKMTCFRCGSFFCWECMSILNSSNPYLHYNATNFGCALFPDDAMDNLFEFGPGEFLPFV